MKVPAKLDDVTPKWLSEVTGLTISENNFNLTANIQEGIGFLSNLIRVSGKTVSGDPVHVVVKLPPEGELLQYLLAMKFDVAEIKCYKEILPQIVEQCPDLQKNLCGFVYGGIDDVDDTHTSVLVLEDLKPQGYRTFDFQQDITIPQVEECVKFLAKLHFGSYALENAKKKPLIEVFPYLEPKNISGLIPLLDAAFKFLETFEDVNSDLLSNYKKLSTLSTKIFEAIVSTKKDYPCFIHTDLWANNVLFNNDNDKPMKVIDWQIASYNDPTFDLIACLITSLPEAELTRQNVERLLLLYYDVFVEACKGSNISAKSIRSFEELSEYFYTYGMGWALLWVLFSMEPLSANKKRLARILEFLELDMEVSNFLLKLLNSEN